MDPSTAVANIHAVAVKLRAPQHRSPTRADLAHDLDECAEALEGVIRGDERAKKSLKESSAAQGPSECYHTWKKPEDTPVGPPGRDGHNRPFILTQTCEKCGLVRVVK